MMDSRAIASNPGLGSAEISVRAGKRSVDSRSPCNGSGLGAGPVRAGSSNRFAVPSKPSGSTRICGFGIGGGASAVNRPMLRVIVLSSKPEYSGNVLRNFAGSERFLKISPSDQPRRPGYFFRASSTGFQGVVVAM
jgi:hypothetical protein